MALLVVAVALASRVVAAAPGNPPLIKARQLYAAGRFEKLQPLLKQALKRAKKSRSSTDEVAEILGMRGAAYAAAKNEPAALKDFTKALDLKASYELPASTPEAILALFQSVRSARSGGAAASAEPPPPAAAPVPPPDPTPEPTPLVAPTSESITAREVTAERVTAPPPAYATSSLDLALLASPPPLEEDTGDVPWYESWWFWATTAVVAGGGAAYGGWTWTRSKDRAEIGPTDLGQMQLQ